MKISLDGKTLLSVQDEDIVDGKFIFPKDITTIESFAFAGCKLQSIIIPDSVKEIHNCAFKGCVQLKTVHLPAKINRIEACTFQGCTELKTVNIPFGVTIIENSAFNGCKNLGSLVLPKSLKKIDESAFAGCGLQEIEFPDELEEISHSAFSGCKALRSVIIPPQITCIQADTFNRCTNLQTVVLHDKVTIIGDNAFSGCINLCSLYLPDGVNYIGCFAFSHCSKLGSVVFPGKIQHILYSSFEACFNLQSLTFSRGITGLIDVYDTTWQNEPPPLGLTNLFDTAFSRCEALKIIIIEADEPHFEEMKQALPQELRSKVASKSWVDQVTATREEELYNAQTNLFDIDPLSNSKALPDEMLALIHHHLKKEEFKKRVSHLPYPLTEQELIDEKTKVKQIVEEMKQFYLDKILLKKLNGYNDRLDLMIKAQRIRSYFFAGPPQDVLIRIRAINKLIHYVSGNQSIRFDLKEIEILTSGLVGQWWKQYRAEESLPKHDLDGSSTCIIM